MKIDHAAAVAAARTWANEMVAWKDCSMAQRLMVLQILRASDAEIFATEQYENLLGLVATWKQRKPSAESRDSYNWMVQQLENCLGV